MVGSTSPRTAVLLRVYYGLLAVSIALSGALTTRHLPAMRDAPQRIVKAAPREAKAPRPAKPSDYASPGINWGGQRR
jgi:hypothetical protein